MARKMIQRIASAAAIAIFLLSFAPYPAQGQQDVYKRQVGSSATQQDNACPLGTSALIACRLPVGLIANEETALAVPLGIVGLVPKGSVTNMCPALSKVKPK